MPPLLLPSLTTVTGTRSTTIGARSAPFVMGLDLPSGRSEHQAVAVGRATEEVFAGDEACRIGAVSGNPRASCCDSSLVASAAGAVLVPSSFGASNRSFRKVVSMAHMSKKGEWFVSRFTWDGKEYKKSRLFRA